MRHINRGVGWSLYVSGRLARLEEWACPFTRLETARFFEINASLNGFVNSERLRRFLNEPVASNDDAIEDFAKNYSAISTDLETGREV
ncbi:MAG: NTE family protein [Gammaproteobacteria bacterium]